MKRTFAALSKTSSPDIAGLAKEARAGYKGLVCTLFLSKSAVKIGLVDGSDLPDPHKLLEGAGKVHKHVVLKTTADLRKPGLKPLVRACVKIRSKS